MSAPYSPTIRRRRLSAELRRLRKSHGLSLQEVAEKTGISRSNLSKIESAESKTVSAEILDKLLKLYGVTDKEDRENLHELARLAGERGWWAKYRSIFPTDLVDFETEASAFRVYEAQVVPGLLQVAGYAEAVIGADKTRSVDEVMLRVGARMRRQQILDRVDPPLYQAVLDEAVLRRPFGSKDVMLMQLRRLTYMAVRHNVEIYVLPFSAGAHLATEGSFLIMDFPDPRDSSVAYVETPVCGLFLEEAGELEYFNSMFYNVRDSSLDQEQSLAFINDVIRSLGGEVSD
ncbi:helix-turn-helix domain-containing protein [Thermobifida cellulosilytica]|uniref:XRE family transcriptional regulator n=1 Tax=Thermobifida cellulosilytica TB100 TaxID=665004 RepID=A0A147KM79_THECS|nr:helix-turn-helix transcriptional regulator [Thermobifida cellulosilytica]KUP98363.1 XRE family transcriptional regulator [Thermobifida cellulosilytica TB100]